MDVTLGQLPLAGCAQLLGIPEQRLRGELLATLREVASARDGTQYLWAAADVYRWAAVMLPEIAGRIPATFWMRASGPAPYLGTERLGGSAVALGWETQLGELWLVWDYPTDASSTLADAAAALRSASAVALVGGDFGRTGPSVWGVLPAAPSARRYEIGWSELSGILGQPVPYWPAPLRIPEVVENWRPGSAAAIAAAIPDPDPYPLLRLAALTEPGGPAQQTLVNLALTWQARATSYARRELEVAHERAEPGTLAVAATPLETPAASTEDLEEAVRRAGWLEILGRRDYLAALCVRQMMQWDGGSDFPASTPAHIDLASPHAQEWERRLVPAPRTALIEVLDPDHSAIEVLADPTTDAPAIRKLGGSLLAIMPQRLPTLSPLSQMILDEPIWVRTQDGVLYPAPQHHYYGLNWGYPGSGPGTLAALADRLLDDIAAQAPGTAIGAPVGLDHLMTRKWPKGTVLTRAQLEAARHAGSPEQ